MKQLDQHFDAINLESYENDGGGIEFLNEDELELDGHYWSELDHPELDERYA